MARDSYLDSLSQIRLFSSASKRDLQKIARASDEIDVPSGKVLVEQGTRGREAFVIIEGSATVEAQRTQGRHDRAGRPRG